MVTHEDSPAEAVKGLKAMFTPEQIEQIGIELELEADDHDHETGK